MTSSVIKSTDARKIVRDLFFHNKPKAERALNFERKCGVKQTKKAPFYSTRVTNKNKELVRKNVTN